MLNIENDSVEGWLVGLKPYQRNHIETLLKLGKSPEEAAETWLSARGTESTLPFGGAGDSRPFLDSFKAEFKKFVCGDKTYDAERSKLLTKADAAKTAVVSGVSSAIAVNVGTTATLLIPAVALMLHVVGKIGVRAWCSETTPSPANDPMSGV